MKRKPPERERRGGHHTHRGPSERTGTKPSDGVRPAVKPSDGVRPAVKPSDGVRPAVKASDGEYIEIVYGLRAGLATLARRPAAIVRAACSVDVANQVHAEFTALAGRGIPCDVLADEELERISGSNHHEGVVIAARPRTWLTPKELSALLLANNGVAVALDRVRNAYNVGAILRSAAFFGVDAVLLAGMATGPDLARNAVRVAEGGVEHLALSRSSDLGETLARMRASGVHVVGADSVAPTSALDFHFQRPTILVLGHEREGLSDRVRASCDAVVSIPGAGRVDSLNVGVAAGVLLAALVRS
ncbi:MAG: RNA methyltransferase [Myxococcales bacterium]|nr:RNA methyltransferase [Myxococcales bacterium]